MGNSRAVAAKHYLQVTEEHFEKACRLPVEAVQNPVHPVQKAVQYPVVTDRKNQVFAAPYDTVQKNN
jgi:hypothetical protein